MRKKTKVNPCAPLLLAAACGLASCGGNDSDPAGGGTPLSLGDLLSVQDPHAPYRINRDAMTGAREFDGEAAGFARPLESFPPSIRTGAMRVIDWDTNAMRTATVDALGDTIEPPGPEGSVPLHVDPSTSAIYVNVHAAASTPAERLRNATRTFAELRVVQSISAGQLAVLDEQLRGEQRRFRLSRERTPCPRRPD